MHNNSVRIILLTFKKKLKKFIARKKGVKDCTKLLLCDANYDRENNDSTNTLRPCRFETVLRTEHLGKVLKVFIGNFYF